MAEAIFKHKVKELGFADKFETIDSFGTSGWHIGEAPDARSTKTCRKHGVPVKHGAQQIKPADFERFDYVIAMDESNKADLLHTRPRGSTSRVELFGNWRTDTSFNLVVEDPYYGGINGFEVNFQQISHFSEEFLRREVGGSE